MTNTAICTNCKNTIDIRTTSETGLCIDCWFDTVRIERDLVYPEYSLIVTGVDKDTGSIIDMSVLTYNMN